MSFLRRKTPLKARKGFKPGKGFKKKTFADIKAGGGLKRGGRLRAVSNSPRAKERAALYKQAVKEYQAAHPNCEYIDGRGHLCAKPVEHNHHRKGRAGDLLFDKAFFMSVCAPHHSHIHDHPKDAYEKGYLLSRSTSPGDQ